MDPPTRRSPKGTHSISGQISRQHSCRSTKRYRSSQRGNKEVEVHPTTTQERNRCQNAESRAHDQHRWSRHPGAQDPRDPASVSLAQDIVLRRRQRGEEVLLVHRQTTEPRYCNCWSDFQVLQFSVAVDNDAEEKHECFVFISDKLAEEITLTIGQAFELAYKRFLETSGKDLESQRRAMITQQKIKRLEQENNIYKQRLLDISHFSNIRPELDQYLRKHEMKNILEVPLATSVSSNDNFEQVNGTAKKLVDFSSDNTNGNGNERIIPETQITLWFLAPPIPPRAFENTPAVGTKLEGLLLNEFDQDNDFDPRSFENNHTNAFSSTNGSASSPPLSTVAAHAEDSLIYCSFQLHHPQRPPGEPILIIITRRTPPGL